MIHRKPAKQGKPWAKRAALDQAALEPVKATKPKKAEPAKALTKTLTSKVKALLGG